MKKRKKNIKHNFGVQFKKYVNNMKIYEKVIILYIILS